MNKAKLYIQLQKMIDAGESVAFMIVDSPHQNKDYAPYVVDLLVKKTPMRQIPYLVLSSWVKKMIKKANQKETI